MSVVTPNLGAEEKRNQMLYQIDNGFVDVVHETPYEGLLTVRASNEDDLKAFTGMTMGDVLTVPHHIYKYILHVPKPVLEAKLYWKDLAQVEKVDRMTPEPVAFAYDYAVQQEDGSVAGDYWFCWPHEIEEVKETLLVSERDILGEANFIPLFCLPKELVGAPLSFPFSDNDDDEITFE
jgi:hypothetical protein